jgi:pimeloyl-ACP methyl ester carboxylesterase
LSGSRELVGRYVNVNGIRTYYESAGEGDGMLCIHTAGRDCRQWQAHLEHFSDRYRVVALDMPGHQKSWPLVGNRCITDRDEFAGFIWAFTEAIGLVNPIVIGCSVGGNIVFLLAQRYPDDVRAVVSYAGADFTPPAAPSVLLNHPQINLADYLYDRNTGLIGRRTPPATRDFILWNVRQSMPEVQQADLAVYGGFDVRDGMSKIVCPCLLIRGTDDWIVSLPMVEATAKRLSRAPVVEVANIEGAGHYAHQELPAECCTVIGRFLKGALVGGATRK